MENEIRAIGKFYSLVEGLIEVLNTPNDKTNCPGCGQPHIVDNQNCSDIH